ncbi:hypothetical protein K502DRAFT_323367 [Neoconidiobolus thromboides FSU 785]|nr:hypothetical protein K502DRAFT_323367 [Neoconidiobolus thromboides FSU 785]
MIIQGANAYWNKVLSSNQEDIKDFTQLLSRMHAARKEVERNVDAYIQKKDVKQQFKGEKAVNSTMITNNKNSFGLGMTLEEFKKRKTTQNNAKAQVEQEKLNNLKRIVEDKEDSKYNNPKNETLKPNGTPIINNKKNKWKKSVNDGRELQEFYFSNTNQHNSKADSDGRYVRVKANKKKKKANGVNSTSQVTEQTNL